MLNRDLARAVGKYFGINLMLFAAGFLLLYVIWLVLVNVSGADISQLQILKESFLTLYYLPLRYIYLYILIEFFVVLASFPVARKYLSDLLKEETSDDIKSNMLKSLYVAIVAALILSIIIPLQIFVASRVYFEFTMIQLMQSCLLLFLIVLCCTFTLLYFLGKKSFLPHLFLLFVLLSVVLNTGIFSYGLPTLDGGLEKYSSPVRSIFDFFIWLFLMVTPFIWYRKLRDKIIFISIGLLVFSCSFFGDQKIQTKTTAHQWFITGTVPHRQVVESIQFAPKDNVIVLILDAVNSEVIEDIFADHPELQKYFSGFVNYANNVGMHFQTSLAFPAIFSGKYYSGVENISRFTNNLYSDDSFIKPYFDKNDPVYVSTLLENASYTNAPLKKTIKKKNVLTDRMEGMFPWQFLELYRFKTVPYFLKKSTLRDIMQTWANSINSQDSHVPDDLVYKKFTTLPVNRTLRRTLQVHHFNAGHPPFLVDANGTAIKSKSVFSYEAYYGRVYFELKRVALLMKLLQERNLYDSSMILIFADHGCFRTFKKGRNAKVPNNAFPALLLKNLYADVPFTNSYIPVSQSKIAALLKTVAKKKLSNDEISDILHIEERIYRETTDSEIKDWIIDKNYKFKLNTQDITKKIHDLTPLKLGPIFRFININNPNYPDFITDNGVRTSALGIDFSQRHISNMKFKVPYPDTKYNLKFDLAFPPKHHGSYRFASGESHTKFDCSDFLVEMKEVSADSDGIVSVDIVPEDANYGITITTIIINKAEDH